MTPECELRVFHLLIGIFIVVLLVFMVSTVIIVKSQENHIENKCNCTQCLHESDSEEDDEQGGRGRI